MYVSVLVAHSCLTLCDPIGCSPPGSSVHGILHARTLEWVENPFSRGSSWPRDWTWVSHITDRFFTIWVTRETSYPLYLYSNHWWNRTNPGVAAAAAAAKSLQLCPTLCDPIDGSPPGSAVPGILQARTLEWVAISFSNAWKWKGKVKSLSYVRLFVTPWTVAHQAPPSMGFSGQEYWSGLPLCVA